MFQRGLPSGSPTPSLLLQCRMLGEPRTSETLEPEIPLFADVIVPRHFAGPFTYLIPAQLRAVLRVGHLVFVPFGRSLVQGAVIAVTQHRPPAVPLERRTSRRQAMSIRVSSPRRFSGIAGSVARHRRSPMTRYRPSAVTSGTSST